MISSFEMNNVRQIKLERDSTSIRNLENYVPGPDRFSLDTHAINCNFCGLVSWERVSQKLKFHVIAPRRVSGPGVLRAFLALKAGFQTAIQLF